MVRARESRPAGAPSAATVIDLVPDVDAPNEAPCQLAFEGESDLDELE
jgi:hypothetical protein